MHGWVADNAIFFAIKEAPLSCQRESGCRPLRSLNRKLCSVWGRNGIESTCKERYARAHWPQFTSNMTLSSIKFGRTLGRFFVDWRIFTTGTSWTEISSVSIFSCTKVKLSDFGMAKEVDKLHVSRSCKGSAYRLAPEVIDPKKTDNHAADTWSLGYTVLEMHPPLVIWNGIGFFGK